MSDTGDDDVSLEDCFEINDFRDNDQTAFSLISGSMRNGFSLDNVEECDMLRKPDRHIPDSAYETAVIDSTPKGTIANRIEMLNKDCHETESRKHENDVVSVSINSISSVPDGKLPFGGDGLVRHIEAPRCDPNRIDLKPNKRHYMFGRTKFHQFGANENEKILKNFSGTSHTASWSEGDSSIFEDEFFSLEKAKKKCCGWMPRYCLIIFIALIAAAICGHRFVHNRNKREKARFVEAATLQPTTVPSALPSFFPSMIPSALPSTFPSMQPSHHPSLAPSTQPSQSPTTQPSTVPSVQPSQNPSTQPSMEPSMLPSQYPTVQPTNGPTKIPTNPPTKSPTRSPTISPTKAPIATEPNIKPGQFYFSKLKSGPLVGHTTQNSTSIWAYHGQGKTMQLVYRRFGDTISNTVQMFPRSNNNNSTLVTIRGLDANTHYIYEIRVDFKVVAIGQVKTAPAFKEGKFEYLLTSCMDIDEYKGYPEQPVWKHVLDKNPDFAILAGDTIYLTEQDWTLDTREVIYDRVWYRNMKQRSEPHFAKVIGSVPTYAAWDDHEYGSNNSEKNQPGKNNSLSAFHDVWANPGYGTPQVIGNFYSYYWGDVHFIVLDNRWYRDRGQQTQLGEDQKNWLFDQLKTSKGSFKVIVNGCDIMEDGYERDVDEIGLFVTTHDIYGVIFNAGDIHRNEFKQMTNGNWSYPVTQFSSSGIARDNWMRPWSIIKVDTERADPIITAHFYGADSEALDTTWSNDPNLRCSSIQGVDEWKEARCTETIRLSDLTPPGVQVPDTVTAPDSEEDKEPPAPHSNIDFSKTDYTVGTYYYPWYGNDNFNGRNYLRAELSPPQYPTLGEYDQRKGEVIAQHFKWSQQANINLWVTSWWGPDSATNRNTIAIMDSAYMEESKIKLALFYEIHGRIPDGNVSNVYGDISYAAKNYFGDPNYYKIDGKPVFYIYLARFLHAIGKLDDAVNEMRRAALDNGFNIYLVGDMAHSNPPQGYYAPFDWLDAITEYDVFGSMDRPDYAGDDNRVEFYRNKQENWRQAAHSQNCDFIPSITPGYNDKGVRDAGYSSMSRKLTRNSEFGSLFQALLNNAVGQVDSAVDNAFMVTSFNEWHEDTQIEPIVGDLTNQPYSHTSGKEYEAYGTRYLDMLRDGTKRTGVSVEPQKR